MIPELVSLPLGSGSQSYLAQQLGSTAQQVDSQHEPQWLWQLLLQQRWNKPAKAANGRMRGRQQLWQLSQQLGAAQQVCSQQVGLAQQVCSQQVGLAQQVCSQQVGAHDEAQQRPNRPALASWAARNDKAATANKAMIRDFMGISPKIWGSLTDTEHTKVALQLPV